MATFLAKPLMMAPAQNSTPPINMDSLLPNFLVTVDATNEAANAARYSDDVNSVSVSLSNLQYWFVDVSSASFRYTAGKNFFRNGAIDVTPPETTNAP